MQLYNIILSQANSILSIGKTKNIHRNTRRKLCIYTYLHQVNKKSINNPTKINVLNSIKS